MYSSISRTETERYGDMQRDIGLQLKISAVTWCETLVILEDRSQINLSSFGIVVNNEIAAAMRPL